MFPGEDIKDNLMPHHSGRRIFWWNVALGATLVVVVGVIAATLAARYHRRQAAPAPAANIPAPSVSNAPTPTAASSPTHTVTNVALAPVKAVSAIPVPATSSAEIETALSAAHALRAAGKPLEAREKCYALLATASNTPAARAIEQLLGEINIELVFKPAAMPEKTDYTVKAGDSLVKIAQQFGTTPELIRKSNQLRGDVIRIGDRLRIFAAPFTVRVSKSANELVLYAGDRFFKRYRVGTGKYGTTPVGTFVINDKISEPPWWRPDGKMVPYGDKENVLGTRWMSLKAMEGTDPVRGYGIHGTWEPETIGQQASAGCVRLLNEEVEELFILLPTGTRVVIEE